MNCKKGNVLSVMKNNKKIIKENINFLEYPTWVVGRKKKWTIWKTETPYGTYEMICPLGLPRHKDRVLLSYLIYQLGIQTKFKSYELRTTRYEIAKNVFGNKKHGKKTFDCIMKSLTKLCAVLIKFDGTFYGGDGNTVRAFSFVDEYTLRKETGELIIKLNEAYVTLTQKSNYYKYIDFDEYIRLTKDSSARLYEILIKTFKERDCWAINLQSFAEKMTFEKREGAKNYYSSDILRHLRPAINEINKKTELKIDFAFNKETSIFVFKKLTTKTDTFVPASKTESLSSKKKMAAKTAKQNAQYLAEFKAMTHSEQKKILEGIEKHDFIKHIPDSDLRIMAYISERKKQ